MIYEWKVDEKLNGVLKGSVFVKIPKYQERLELIKEMPLDTLTGDKTDIEKMNEFNKVVEIALRHINRVHLFIGSDLITDIKELEYYSVYQSVVNEVINLIVNGISLGNVKESQSNLK